MIAAGGGYPAASAHASVTILDDQAATQMLKGALKQAEDAGNYYKINDLIHTLAKQRGISDSLSGARPHPPPPPPPPPRGGAPRGPRGSGARPNPQPPAPSPRLMMLPGSTCAAVAATPASYWLQPAPSLSLG
jgi:hypothetical protein